MPKWLFWLALFFVLFLIYTQPTNAGNIAGGFGEFAVDLLSAIGEFLTGLFDGASEGRNTPRGSSGASFTHTHDGTTHTHHHGG